MSLLLHLKVIYIYQGAIFIAASTPSISVAQCSTCTQRQIYTGRRMITSLQHNYQSLSGKVRVVESRTANLQERIRGKLKQGGVVMKNQTKYLSLRRAHTNQVSHPCFLDTTAWFTDKMIILMVDNVTVLTDPMACLNNLLLLNPLWRKWSNLSFRFNRFYT